MVEKRDVNIESIGIWYGLAPKAARKLASCNGKPRKWLTRYIDQVSKRQASRAKSLTFGGCCKIFGVQPTAVIMDGINSGYAEAHMAAAQDKANLVNQIQGLVLTMGGQWRDAKPTAKTLPINRVR